MNMYVIAN